MDGERGRAASAADAINRLRDALSSDEIVAAAGPALKRADDDAFGWLQTGLGPGPEVPPTPGPDADPPPPDSPTPVPRNGSGAGHGIRAAGDSDEELLAHVRAFLAEPRCGRRRVVAGPRMTVSNPRAAPPPPATVSTAFAMIEEAKRGRYTSGVIGLMARPDRRAEQDVTHDGQLVRIRAAESALAVREALLEYVEGDAMVVLTDRTDDDLGAGVLAHFAWQRLRRPDLWEAVRHRFQASGVDPALTTAPGNRELAVRLLAAAPDAGWPAGPAGVLTRAHALGAAAHVTLGLAGDVVDAITVLDWAIRPQSVQALADLRSEHGDTLADALLDWLAENSGTAAAPVRALLARGDVADLVPVGLVAHLLTNVAGTLPEQRHQAELGLARLDAQFGQPKPSPASIAALGAAAAAVVTDLAQDPLRTAHLTRVLARADTLLQGVEATHLAIHSDLLPRGYRHRLGLLAEALRRGIDDMTNGLVHPQSADATRAVESAWGFAARHRLGRSDSPRSARSRPRSGSGDGSTCPPARPTAPWLRQRRQPGTTSTTTRGPTPPSTTLPTGSTTASLPTRCGASSRRRCAAATRANASLPRGSRPSRAPTRGLRPAGSPRRNFAACRVTVPSRTRSSRWSALTTNLRMLTCQCS